MKRFKLFLTTVISLITASLLAASISDTDVPQLKTLATTLLANYASSDDEELPVQYYGDGQVHSIKPSEIGWASDVIYTGQPWKIHIVASRTDISTSYNGDGSFLLSSKNRIGLPFNLGFRLRQNPTGSLCYIIGTGAGDNTKEFEQQDGKKFDIIIESDGSKGLVVRSEIDDIKEIRAFDHTIIGEKNAAPITDFSYALPTGFNINSLFISSAKQVKVSANDDSKGEVELSVDGKDTELSFTYLDGNSIDYTTYPLVCDGDPITVSANPKDGYMFVEWRDENGNRVSGSQSYSFTMGSEEKELVAIFDQADYEEPARVSDDKYTTFVNEANQYYQFVESFTYNGVKFYGDISKNSEELNTLFHIVNSKETALVVAPGTYLCIDWKTPDNMTGLIILSAFCDLDFDKVLDGEKDYRQVEQGSYKSTAFNNHTGTVTIPIPENAPVGAYTRVRLRFDGSYWDIYSSWNEIYNAETKTLAANCGIAYAASNRHVYDIIVKISDKVDLNVGFDNSMGKVTAKVGDETYYDYPQSITLGSTVTLTADPNPGYSFVKWTDKDGNDIADGTNSVITIASANDNIVYNAVFEGTVNEGKYEICCQTKKEHIWELSYRAIGTTAAIRGLELKSGSECCTDGCVLTIPDVLEKAYRITHIDNSYRDIDVTLVQVGTTIIHGQHHIKKLTLPSTVEEIRRSRVLDLSRNRLDLIDDDIPTGITNTHAGSGYAHKWQVDPKVDGQMEWWFVGVFDFPAEFDHSQESFKDWGCALLTSRKWPSQDKDNWTNRFQIWVNGTRSHRKAGTTGTEDYPLRKAGDIRLVNSYNSANDDPYFLYFKDKDGNNINVLDDETSGTSKVVRFEVHNYPDATGTGSTVIYTVQTFDKSTYGTDNPIVLQEGSIETHVANLQEIDWISNYVPSDVTEKLLKFYRPETHMTTYRDGADKTEEFTPTEDCTHGGKKIILSDTQLTTDEPWLMAIHYIPQFDDKDEIIIATDDNWSTNINQSITNGFRIVQKAKDNNLYFQSSEPTAAEDLLFKNIKITPGYPLTIIVYHYPDGKLAVSATDRLNGQIERFEVEPQIKKTISELHTSCTYDTHKFDVTVAGTEHLLFANCPYLEEINVTNNTIYKSIDGAVYDKNGYTLIAWPEGKVKPGTDANSTVKASTYSADESEIVLPASVRRIDPLAFFNVRDNEVKDLTVHVDNIDEIDRLSYVNASITYETTPKHFVEMKKNDQISFRLNLEQGTSALNDGYLAQIDEKTYSQIALPDRFASATSGNWNTFVVPFDVYSNEIYSDEIGVNTNFTDARKLEAADVYVDDAQSPLTLRVKFDTQTTLDANTPYIVKVGDNITNSVADAESGHGGEMRFNYRPFKVKSSNDDLEHIGFKATEDESLKTYTRSVDYTYYVNMYANIDPKDVEGTDYENPNTANNYEYIYMLSQNSLKLVGKNKTAKNKGFRGYMKITATPKNGSSTSTSSPIMSMLLNDSGEATAIIEVQQDDEVLMDNNGKPADIYSLSGVRLGNSFSSLPAGVYIINNKKVVKP